MSVVHRVRSLVGRHGVRGVFVKLAGLAMDWGFERRYGVDTMSVAPLDELTIEGVSRDRATADYEPSRVMSLRGVLAVLKELDPAGALVDLGCGKGKVLLVAAECGVAKVRGVEFARELCEIARANWRTFQARTHSACEVEIIEGDAAAYRFRPEETLVFIFNPFDETVLAQVLANLAASTREHPRSVHVAIACLSEHYRRAIAEQRDFVVVRELVSWACPFSILSNAAGVHAAS